MGDARVVIVRHQIQTGFVGGDRIGQLTHFHQQIGTLHMQWQKAGVQGQRLLQHGRGRSGLLCATQRDGLAQEAHDACQFGGVGRNHGRQLSTLQGRIIDQLAYA